MDTEKIIAILNGMRESYEMDFAECEHARECETCKECYAYKAAQALGFAINAVKYKERAKLK